MLSLKKVVDGAVLFPLSLFYCNIIEWLGSMRLTLFLLTTKVDHFSEIVSPARASTLCFDYFSSISF